MSGYPRRVYFAHPVTTYGTDEESDALAMMRWKYFPKPEWEIVNPNDAQHEAAYKRFGMQYFIELCGECDECVFMSFLNGKIGAGAAAEVQSFFDRGRPVSEFARDIVWTTTSIDGRVLSVDETRRLIAEIRGEV